LFVLGLSNHIISAGSSVKHLHCYTSMYTCFSLLLLGILIILTKPNYFAQVVCLEVSLILVLLSSLSTLHFIWVLLPILGFGASEGSLALALAVHLSRSVDLGAVSI